MKKYVALLFIVLISCTGENGDVGPKGEKGDKGDRGEQGIQGEAGSAGKDGTSATARYYDVKFDFSGATASSTTNYSIPSFNPQREYPLLFVVMGNNALFKALPINGAAINTSGVAVIVDLEYTYGASGKLFLADWEYADSGVQSFMIRVVVAPMAAGLRTKNPTYEELQEMFNLDQTPS